MAKQKRPLDNFEKITIKGARRAVRKTAEILQKRIIENATLTDHSLDQLEKLGHPYAVRNLRNLHTPNFQLHAQSGNLAGNIEVVKVNDNEYVVGVDEDKVPYIRHVVRGTQFMIPRDFITGSFLQIRKTLLEIFGRDVDKTVRGIRGDTSEGEKS